MFWALTVLAIAEFVRSRNANWWLVAGLFAGLGLLSKYNVVFLGAGILLYLMTSRERLAWLRLSRTENVGPITFHRLIQRYGSASKAIAVQSSIRDAAVAAEGDDDLALKGTDLKERFYKYLVDHHGRESQVIIIENQHPPENVIGRLAMTVFTGNPSDGRFGLL
jgi:hypothetical protein